MERRTKKNICTCDGKVSKEPLIALGGCSDDLAAASVLPNELVPRQCGAILTNYLKERERNHEEILENLMRDATTVNKNVDAKVRTLAEMLLSHIQQNQKDIDCVTQQSKPDSGVLSVDERNEALKKITKLSFCRTQDLTQFKQEALELERQRADGIRSVLKTQFHRLIGVGHKTPKDLLHEFDERIYDINQQLLSNARAHIELEAQLRIQLDENVTHARAALNQLSLKKSSNLVRGQSASPWMRKSQTPRDRCDSAGGKKVDPGTSSRDVTLDIEEFKTGISQLVEAYRSAILEVFTGFSCQLDNLHKNIGFVKLKEDRNVTSAISVEFDNTIQRALRRISSSNVQLKGSVYKDLEEMAGNDVLNMQRGLFTLGNRLRHTYMVLYNASHLWDDHILRTALVQKLTMAAVEDIQNSHDAMELANEINLNITLEQLRCAPDIDKLQQNYDVARNLMDRIKEIYLQHNEIEIAKLEEYMNLISILANVLLSECDCFLENNPKTTVEPSGSLTSSPGAESPIVKTAFSLCAPLPQAILQSRLQDVALNNWKNSFLDSFTYNLPMMPEQLNHQARKWIDEKSLHLNMRHSLKLMSHSIRAERVNAAREARLAELRFHDQRLNCHLEAIYFLVDNIPLNVSGFLAIDASELYPFCKWIKNIQTDMDDLLAREPLDLEIKRLKMSSYAPRLIKHRLLFEESLDSAIEQYKKNIEREIQVARISNYRFMSQLKLFIDGGRYAAQEATKTSAALVKAADALELCIHRSMDALHHRRLQLLALADQQILPLQRVVEVHKSGPKTFPDKKKPTSTKKK